MQTKKISMIILSLSILLLGLNQCEKTSAFIEREYTLKEIIDASTNIVSGRVKSVNKKRMHAVAEISENLKGKTEFRQIKMNIAVGDTRRKLTSPQMMMNKLEEGLPVIFFYEKKGRNLAALGYVSGTWFQLFANDQSNRDKVWWRHTHIEAYMHRTFSGTTESLHKVVKDMLAGKAWAGTSDDAVKVLVLTGNSTKPVLGQASPETAKATAEYLALRKFDEVTIHGFLSDDKLKVAYHPTKERKLPHLEDAHILWIGQGEISENRYLLPKNTEQKIKDFVRNGGIVITVGQDSDLERPCETGWITRRIVGVERNLRNSFQITNKAGNLFEVPNKVKSGQLHIDDTWTNWDNNFDILATTNSGKDIVVATLREGRGMYIVTGIQNENTQDVDSNSPLMENLIHFAVNWLR